MTRGVASAAAQEIEPVASGKHVHKQVFCANCKWLNDELEDLHRKQAKGVHGAQVEIDSRIFMCIAAESGWETKYPHIPLHWLKTSFTDTVQYTMLPDVMQYITASVSLSAVGTCKGAGNKRQCRAKKINVKQNMSGYIVSGREGIGSDLLEILVQTTLPTLRKTRVVQNPVHAIQQRIRACPHANIMVVCINIMYGTLLGLYPTTVKKPVFGTRKQIFHCLRRLATSEIETQRAFLLKYSHLLKICFMEYVANVSRDFYVTLDTVLFDSSGLDVYCSVCSNVCDVFRMECLQTDTCTWEKLEQHAALVLERFGRTCKFKTGNELPWVSIGSDPCMSAVHSWRELFSAASRRRSSSRYAAMGKVRQSDRYINDPPHEQIYDRQRTVLAAWRKDVASGGVDMQTNNTVLQIAMAAAVSPYFPGVARLTLDTVIKELGMPTTLTADTVMSARTPLSVIVESLQNHVMCYPLPKNLVQLCCENMVKYRSADLSLMCKQSRLNVCMWCLHKITLNPFQHKLRMDVTADKFSCSVCHDSPVVAISLLGRLLRIGRNYYYFCPCCLQIQPWVSTGTEFTRQTCDHIDASVAKKGVRKSVHTRRNRGVSVNRESYQDTQHDLLPGDSFRVCAEQHTCVPKKSLKRNMILQFAWEKACYTVDSTASFLQMTTSRLHRYCCVVCEKRQAVTCVRILHVPWRRVVGVMLCAKHDIPMHLRRYVYDTWTLRKILKHAENEHRQSSRRVKCPRQQ